MLKRIRDLREDTDLTQEYVAKKNLKLYKISLFKNGSW